MQEQSQERANSPRGRRLALVTPKRGTVYVLDEEDCVYRPCEVFLWPAPKWVTTPLVKTFQA